MPDMVAGPRKSHCAMGFHPVGRRHALYSSAVGSISGTAPDARDAGPCQPAGAMAGGVWKAGTRRGALPNVAESRMGEAVTICFAERVARKEGMTSWYVRVLAYRSHWC